MRFIAGKINEPNKRCCVKFPLDSHDIVCFSQNCLFICLSHSQYSRFLLRFPFDIPIDIAINISIDIAFV